MNSLKCGLFQHTSSQPRFPAEDASLRPVKEDLLRSALTLHWELPKLLKLISSVSSVEQPLSFDKLQDQIAPQMAFSAPSIGS